MKEARTLKQCFLTTKGPKAIGPYSTAVISGDLCFLSGVIPVDPATCKLSGDDIRSQSTQVFDNMRVILEEMGASLGDVLKTTVFLTDLNSFGEMNSVYGEYFGADYPARSCVQVAALPMGARIEVEAVVSLSR